MNFKPSILQISLILLLTTVFTAFLSAPQPNDNILKSILFKLETYYSWYPQQKVYLHLDKNNYDASETVWFKAYILNASDHRADTISNNLYVDLIDPAGNIVQQKLLKINHGFANGDFSFKDTISEGVYRLKAYTNWMLNTDEDYLFSRDIYISNPEFRIYATREKVRTVKKESRKNEKKAQKFDVSFYPEGGHMLADTENRIGFKAVNELGAGIDVSGRIVDNRGRTAGEFKSSRLGIGSFSFTPRHGTRYSAIAKNPDGDEERFEFPESINSGISLRFTHAPEGNLEIKMISSFHDRLPANTTYFLVGHSRGVPVYTATFDLQNENNTVIVDESTLPSGVLHFTLFNYNSNPVSERLVFINNSDALNVEITPSATVSSPREKVNVKIKVTDRSGNPVRGNFSLGVAPGTNTPVGENILSNLLLDSDIKGKIEQPGYYFAGYNEQKETELDNLLLTQGWRRFRWQTVMLNQKRPVQYPEENKITVSGRITKEFFGRPLRDIPVTLTVLNAFNDVYQTRSRYDGRFIFEGLEYYDTLSVKIEAKRRSGRKNLVIALDYKEPEPVEEMNYITNQYLKRAGSVGKYYRGVEKPPDDPFHEKNTHIDRIHSEPKDVILVGDQFQTYSTVAQVLQGRIPGVQVNGYKVIIRGVSSFYGNTDPLFLVDNIQVDPYTALSMPPVTVERIEVLKGPEAAIYGSRGGNGVIAIYTRRGKFMIKGVLNFDMQAYATPKEYYSPKYPFMAEDDYADDRQTLTWIPFIETDNTGQASAEFFTSDVTGTFTISMEGIDAEGTPGASQVPIEIR